MNHIPNRFIHQYSIGDMRNIIIKSLRYQKCERTGPELFNAFPAQSYLNAHSLQFQYIFSQPLSLKNWSIPSKELPLIRHPAILIPTVNRIYIEIHKMYGSTIVRNLLNSFILYMSMLKSDFEKK